MKNIKHIFLLSLLYAIVGASILGLVVFKNKQERPQETHTAKKVEKVIYLSPAQYKVRQYVLEELKKAGLSKDYAIIPFIESGYNTDAVSPVGATGIWQFMPLTALDMGLDPNDRTDYKKSTKAGIKYIKWLDARFNDELNLVLASYNAGVGRVKKRIKKYNSRHHLNLNLPTETKNYIVRFHKYKEYTFKLRGKK